jgi:predicted dehydrogenase
MSVLIKTPDLIRLGIIGMTPGNEHPYSWSAIINNYDRAVMTAECPSPGIPVYLNREPAGQVGIDGVRVTHIWCDNRKDAEKAARCSLIEQVADSPEAMIGEVDAVIIATDIGGQHVSRAKPFVDAGLPVFIDKPLCDNRNDLDTFKRWVADGAAIMSSSCMRYCKEFRPWHRHTRELGDLRLISMPMAKKWETYGIHALEAVYPILGTGFISVRNTGNYDRNVVHLRHRDQVDVIITCIKDLKYGAPMQLGGTQANISLQANDTYQSFRGQLMAFIEYLRTGIRPFPFSETEELMQLLIGAIESREQGGKEILINLI